MIEASLVRGFPGEEGETLMDSSLTGSGTRKNTMYQPPPLDMLRGGGEELHKE